MQFNADVADGMQWKFTPTQREVCFRLHKSRRVLMCVWLFTDICLLVLVCC